MDRSSRPNTGVPLPAAFPGPPQLFPSARHKRSSESTWNDSTRESHASTAAGTSGRQSRSRKEHSPLKRRFSFAAKCLITDLTLTTLTYTPKLSPLPRGKQAQFGGWAAMGIARPWPSYWGSRKSPRGSGRVSVVDLGEVGRARRLGLRRWVRGGAAGGFAGDSEVVQNLAYRFWLCDCG